MKSLFLKSFSLCLLLVGAATLVSCGEDDDDILGPQIEPVVPHDVTLDATNFPDDIFRAYVSRLTGVEEDEVITAEVLAEVTEIDVHESHIQSLKGIEHFTLLEYLNCHFNNLTSLDVSNNIKLKRLDCDHNELTSLDVSKNVALKKLECSSNDLTSMDVSKNVALETLYCAGNQLDLLDVSKNVALEYLNCHFNNLTSLDVSNNIKLKRLDCDHNELTSLDVSKNVALEYLGCTGNQLTSLDVSKNVALKELDCEDNQLTSLDVSKNVALEELYCYSNQLTSLISSPTGALVRVSCFSNQLRGAQMDALIAGLPVFFDGGFWVIDTDDSSEGNVCTVAQVNAARAKGWLVLDVNGGFSYSGS